MHFSLFLLFFLTLILLIDCIPFTAHDVRFPTPINKPKFRFHLLQSTTWHNTRPVNVPAGVTLPARWLPRDATGSISTNPYIPTGSPTNHTVPCVETTVPASSSSAVPNNNTPSNPKSSPKSSPGAGADRPGSGRPGGPNNSDSTGSSSSDDSASASESDSDDDYSSCNSDSDEVTLTKTVKVYKTAIVEVFPIVEIGSTTSYTTKPVVVTVVNTCEVVNIQVTIQATVMSSNGGFATVGYGTMGTSASTSESYSSYSTTSWTTVGVVYVSSSTYLSTSISTKTRFVTDTIKPTQQTKSKAVLQSSSSTIKETVQSSSPKANLKAVEQTDNEVSKKTRPVPNTTTSSGVQTTAPPQAETTTTTPPTVAPPTPAPPAQPAASTGDTIAGLAAANIKLHVGNPAAPPAAPAGPATPAPQAGSATPWTAPKMTSAPTATPTCPSPADLQTSAIVKPLHPQYHFDLNIVNNHPNEAVYIYIESQSFQTSDGRTLPVLLGPDLEWRSSKNPNGMTNASQAYVPGPVWGTNKKYTIYGDIPSSRMYISVGGILNWGTNGNTGLAEPVIAGDTKFAVVELERSGTGIFANIGYVDYASLPLGIRLNCYTGPDLQTIDTKSPPISASGITRDAVDAVCQAYKNLPDASLWMESCQQDDNGKYVRIMSPANSPKLISYLDDYINTAWKRYATTGAGGLGDVLTLNLPNNGVSTCTITSDQIMHCSRSPVPYVKPKSLDVYGCASGPFDTTTAAQYTSDPVGWGIHLKIVPILCAAFWRTLINLDGTQGSVQPSLEGIPYTAPKTAQYGKLLHLHNSDGSGYTFPYDDVAENGVAVAGCAQCDYLNTLTVVVGGPMGQVVPGIYDTYNYY